MAPPNPPGPELPPGRDNPNPTPPNRFSKGLLGWVIFFAMGLLLVMLLSRQFDERREVSYVQFWNYIDNRQVTGKIYIYDNRIEGENTANVYLAKGESRKFKVPFNYATEQNFAEHLRTSLVKNNVPAEPVFEVNNWWNTILPNIVLMVLAFLAVWFFLFRRLGNAAGGGGFLGGFGRSRHRVLTKEHTKVTFDDVAGIEEAKDEVREIIEFLRNSKKFQRLGGRVPRGVLLVGEPGCGKTLLAKAIAGEAEVPFFSISGSDFVEMFVGVGASRVRDLFRQAKESSPCIIFLDEIDAVGRRRGMGFNGGGHDEREQTLNAILVEMDGFDTSDQVIVIAATNRSDVLDPALTRPGRFDRQIHVPLPDLAGRLEILKIYAHKVRCGPDVDLHRLARGTPMFSGADLAALVNEAAIAAAMGNKDCIEQADLEEARDKVRWGRARKSRVVDEHEKEITAYHEAGHALVQMLTPGTDPLHKVSIIPRGEMGGATFSLPEKDRYLYTRNYCKALLTVMLGGRVSEEVFCHDVSSGAASDIGQATDIAKKMILDWGMSDRLGMIRFSSEERRMMFGETAGKEYSEKTAETIDQEIKALVDEAYAATHRIIEENRQKVQDIASALMKYETLSADDVKRLIDGLPLEKTTVDDLLQREQARPAAGGASASSPAASPAPRIPPLPEPG
jgi:cell division protease FtsH